MRPIKKKFKNQHMMAELSAKIPRKSENCISLPDYFRWPFNICQFWNIKLWYLDLISHFM